MFVQIKRDQVVTVLGELITGHTEFASIITDVVASKVPIIKSCHDSWCMSVVDTETGLAEEKKDERSRLVGLVREIERFLSDGLVKVKIVKRK